MDRNNNAEEKENEQKKCNIIIPVMLGNSVFENLSKIQIRKLMDLLDVHVYKFKKNEL